MLKFIILSEDSAFNTNLFLKSMNTFVKGDYSATVIYKSSTKDYSLMYEVVFKRNSEEFDFDYVKTEDFKEQILYDLDERTEEDYVCICTSEDIFYRAFVIPDLDELFSDNDILAFHTRLGKNIVKNSRIGSDNIFKPEIDGKICIYDWSKHYVDFGEPFTIHGSIYRKNEIRKLINKIPFESREDLQEGFNMFGNYKRHKAACSSKSTLLTQVKDPNPKTAHLTKMLTNIKLQKGEDFKPFDFDIGDTDEIEKDIGVLKMLTGKESASV